MSNNIWLFFSTSQPPVDVNDQPSSKTSTSSLQEANHLLFEPKLSFVDLSNSGISLSQPTSLQSYCIFVLISIQDILEPPTQWCHFI